jgi:peptidyl-prolyl cis-trans isomerase SurA
MAFPVLVLNLKRIYKILALNAVLLGTNFMQSFTINSCVPRRLTSLMLMAGLMTSASVFAQFAAPRVAPAPVVAAKPVEAPLAASKPVSINRIIAVVNDAAITKQEVDDRVTMILRRAAAQGGAAPNRDELQKQVLDRLVTERAQMQIAKEFGIKIDDISLDRTMLKIAEENKMTLQQLRNQVEKEGTTYAQFREDMREEFMRQRVQEREVLSKIVVSDLEVDNYLAAEAATPDSVQELNLSHIFVMIPENANAEQIKVRFARAQEIMSKIRAGEDFAKLALTYSDGSEGAKGGSVGWREVGKIPPDFVAATAKLKVGEVTDIIRGANGFHIVKLVDQRTTAKVKEAATVQQTRARHILIKVSPIVPAAEARRRLVDIKNRIESKTSTFEDEAKANSGDGSASKGGDLGWIYPGDTVPQFEEAMNKLELNIISDPVETQFGYHLIQVVERKTDDVSKERKRAAARQVLRERKSEEALQNWLREIRDSAYVEYRLDPNAPPTSTPLGAEAK